MYEIYKLYTIGLVTFTLTGIVYFAIAIIYYKVKIKELKNMATDLTKSMLDRLCNVEGRISSLEQSVARLSTTVQIWGVIVMFLVTLLGSYIVTTHSNRSTPAVIFKKSDKDVSNIGHNINKSFSNSQKH